VQPFGATEQAPIVSTRVAEGRAEARPITTTSLPVAARIEAAAALVPVARRGRGSIAVAVAGVAAAGVAAAGGAIMAIAVLVRAPAAPVASVSAPPVAIDSAHEIKPSPPPAMVRVAAGTFQMGTENGGSSEGPVHQVTITRAFDLDRTEVTVGAYAACVDARKCKPAVLHGPFITDALVAQQGSQCTGIDRSRSSVAINCVDQLQAAAYCEFMGKRLPTEAEWELAARGTDGRVYPWGSEPPTCDRSNFAPSAGESCGVRPRAPMEVGSLPLGASPSGAVDLAGNVWEWVADGWDPVVYQRGTSVNPRVRSTGRQGVLRGGGWDQAASTVRSTTRLAYDSTTGHVGTGFRCARTLE
jgi:eukaryotic-like serine/threonine-protein kinase